MASKSPKPGQIVLIRLKNFMSYDEIELRPGFNLNLIVGPNGTGKSTFVCAVVLGLGGRLEIIGRCGNLRSYVKIGCHESWIEIVLYDPSENNVLIQRKISSDNQSEFYINGEAADETRVDKIRCKYNIMLDNLCTFLPQEKVQDFWKLSPQVLLDSAQKAIGRYDMVKNFETLKAYQRKVDNKEKECKSIISKIDELMSKNEILKEKVTRYYECKAAREKVYKITQKKTWLHYYEVVNEVEGLKEKYLREEEKFKRLKGEFDLYNLDISKIEAEMNFYQKMYDDARVVYREKIRFLRGDEFELRNMMEKLENVRLKTNRKLKEDEFKRKELNGYQENLDKLLNDLRSFEIKNGGEEALISSEKLITEELEKSLIDEKRTKAGRNVIEDDVNKVRMEIRNLSAEYKLLESRKNTRLEYLKQHEPDVYQTMEWLKDNRKLFRGRVYGPVVMELDVTDRKYAKYVEACVAYRDLIAFVCSDADDLNLFIEKVREGMKFRINGLVVPSADPQQYRPKLPLNEIRDLGFNCYMKDLLVGPGSIISYLCRVYKVHQIPIAERVEHMDYYCVPSALMVYFTKNQMYSIRSSFFSRDKSITVKKVDEPVVLCKPLTCHKLDDVRAKQLVLCEMLAHKEMNLNLASHFVSSVSARSNNLRLKQKHLIMLRDELSDIKFKIKQAEDNVNAVKALVKGQDVIQEEARKERQELIENIQLKVLEMVKKFEELQRIVKDLLENDMRHHFYKFKAHNVTEMNWEVRENYYRQKEVRDEKRIAYFKRKVECKRLRKHAEKITLGLSPGAAGFEAFENEFKSMSGSLKQLESELREMQVKNDFYGGVDVKVVEEYEEREREIETLHDALDRAYEIVAGFKEEMDDVREEWLVPINELVSQINEKFSSFFESMGCVGEVSLIMGENEDLFDQYGISIKVKFRDDGPLQTLGRHFQSNGERAMATAVYLLSLQELASVPFKFVDEINQGMDSTNEKRIIDYMIEATRRDKSTQYFFISPKLIPGIEGSETMVTHCIYSGRNAIPSVEWNLDKFLNDN